MRTSYEYTVSKADRLAAMKFNNGRIAKLAFEKHKASLLWILNAGACVLVLLCAFLLGKTHITPAILALLLVLVAGNLYRPYFVNTSVFDYVAGQDGYMSGPRMLHLEERGLRIVEATDEMFIYWHGMRSLEELEQQALIYLNGVTYCQVSYTAFSSLEERAEFLAFIRSKISTTTEEVAAPQTVPADAGTATDGLEAFAAPSTTTSRSFLAALSVNLRSGLRLMCFLRPLQAPQFSWGQLITLVLLGLVLPNLLQFARIGMDGYFSTYALPGALFIVPLLIVAAWLLALLDKQTEQTPTLLAALFSLAVPMAVVQLILPDWISTLGEGSKGSFWAWLYWYGAYAATLWLALAAAVAAIRLLVLPRRLWVSALAVCGLLIFWPLADPYRDVSLWVEPYDDDGPSSFSRTYYALTNEDSLYRQPLLLDQALAQLRDGKPGVLDLYFIGMAGYASQDVFMKEVNSVEQLFAERFGASGHSIKLINNAATVDTVPVASATGLQKSLQRVAAVMNRDEDILFLFMTSHGSRDHKFSVDFGAMKFNDIDPPILRKMLDESGIKRRVIVVSACYSGGFIDALKDDNSLVITAAAPDKSSFGCSNESDFTYFGQAYFNEALRETYSFTEAFETAKVRIAEREKAEKFEPPSDPRMALGKDIAPVLEAFSRKKAATQSPSK